MAIDPFQCAPFPEIDSLVRDFEKLPESTEKNIAGELLHAIFQFHGAALKRLIEQLQNVDTGNAPVEELARDPLVHQLLLLHGLHPVSIERRVRDELQTVEQYWNSAGYKLFAIVLEGGVLRLQFNRPRPANIGPTLPLKSLVERAAITAAPDVNEVIVEGLDGEGPQRLAGFVPLAKLLNPAASMEFVQEPNAVVK
jgi:hypothetical protein